MCYIYIYIYIYNHYYFADSMDIPDSLSLSLYPYHPLFLAGFPNFIQRPLRADVSKFLLLHLCAGSTEKCHDLVLASLAVSRMSCLSWIVFEMSCKWHNNCCFIGCCFQDLFKIVGSILVSFLSAFFSMHFLIIHVVHPHSSIDTVTAWRNPILSY